MHTLFVIASLQGAWVREDQATSTLVSPLPPVCLPLHPRPERFVLDLAQEGEAFEGLPQGGERLRSTIGWSTAGETFSHAVGRGRAGTECGGPAHQLVPLCTHEGAIDRAGTHGGEAAIMLRPIQLGEPLLVPPQTRHHALAQEVTQAKELIGRAVLVDNMLLGP